MSLEEEIAEGVADLLLPGVYDTIQGRLVPLPTDSRLTFGPRGIRFEAACLFADVRGSTQILLAHKPHTVAKVHKAFLFLVTRLVASHGGEIRSYNGDSILAFFSGGPTSAVPVAVQCASEIAYMLHYRCASEFERYHELDFGIGVDHGEILCVKAGVGRNETHNDLVWLGEAVNRAARLGSLVAEPLPIAISDLCHEVIEGLVATCALPTTFVQVGDDDRWVEEVFEFGGQMEHSWRSDTWAWAP